MPLSLNLPPGKVATEERPHDSREFTRTSWQTYDRLSVKMVDAIEANTHLWPWRCVHRKLGWTTARRLWCPGAGCGMLRVFQWGFRLSHLQIWINWRRKELSWNMNPFAGCVWANPFAGLARWCTLWRQASCSILFFLPWEVNSRRVERRQSTWLGKARESGHGNREGMQNRKQINVENPSKSSNPFTISYQLFSSNFMNFFCSFFRLQVRACRWRRLRGWMGIWYCPRVGVPSSFSSVFRFDFRSPRVTWILGKALTIIQMGGKLRDSAFATNLRNLCIKMISNDISLFQLLSNVFRFRSPIFLVFKCEMTSDDGIWPCRWGPSMKVNGSMTDNMDTVGPTRFQPGSLAFLRGSVRSLAFLLQGVEHWVDGARYEGKCPPSWHRVFGALWSEAVKLGRYTAGKKHGQGSFTWSDGSSYNGEDWMMWTIVCRTWHMTSVKVIPTVLANVGYIAIQLITVKEGTKDI